MVRKIYLEAKRAAAFSPRLLLCLLGLAAGCDRSSEESEQSRQCARFCDELEGCDDGTDVLDCRKHCESDEVRSEAYFRARADCATEQSCNQWMQEVDSQGDSVCTGEDCNLNECVDRTLLDEKLSEQEERSCMVISSSLRKCDSGLEAGSVADECERVAPMLSENYLEDSETCVLSDCEKIERCLSDLADRHGTELKVFSGIFMPR
jgi:hypothetical protein